MIPSVIDLFFMIGKRTDKDLHLFQGKCARKQFAVNTNDGLVSLIFRMNMWLVMLLVIAKPHIHHQRSNSIEFAHFTILLMAVLYHKSSRPYHANRIS